MLEAPQLDSLRTLFRVPVNPYWNTHTDFDRPARPAVRKIGVSSVNSILLNTLVPFLFCYGKRRGGDRFIEHALELITLMAPEENTVTSHWAMIGMPNTHAGQSQALIHLKKEYCDARACVHCAIGNNIIASIKE
jgi:hypothetical protein